MPLLLEPILSSILPLFKKRDTYYIAAIAVLALLLWGAHRTVAADAAVIAARPAVHTEAEQQLKIVRVSGPERVEVRTVYAPGTNTIQYVDRIVTTAPVTTTTEKDSEVVKDVRPACPAAAPAPWRTAAAVFDPTAPTKLVGLRGDATLFKWLVLGAGLRFSPRPEGQAEVGVRF